MNNFVINSKRTKIQVDLWNKKMPPIILIRGIPAF